MAKKLNPSSPAKTIEDKPRAQNHDVTVTAAIAAVEAGERIECSKEEYHTAVRDALHVHALRVNHAGKTEKCRAILDLVRTLDDEHADQWRPYHDLPILRTW